MAETIWWKRGIIYQIYPRSFQDSDGDGIGDLEGIRRRLDHPVWLGVDAIWISPIYPSPMADFGYDVADYCDVDPRFGTLAQFDALIADAHARGLRVILDFVPNHSSDQHPWFRESRSSTTNPKRDWYIWRDPAPDGGPPNNWLSQFGGSAWERDPATGQYYLHSFLKEQPDLNWRNPAVQEAMFQAMRFWLDRGVDGFRVDVIWLLIKDDQFRDNPPNPAWRPDERSVERLLQRYTADRPEVQDVVAAMRAVVDEYADRVLIGEIYLPIERLVAFYGRDLKGAQLPFNFQLISTAWSAAAIAELVRDYEAALPPGAWPNWVLGNHDQSRIATRLGEAQARVAAMLLLTLRGTPTLYYGDELGMVDVPIPPDRIQDPWAKNEPGLGLGRDPSRTPMPWDDQPNAGFSSAEPWLPLNPDHAQRNVARLQHDDRSILTLYRRLIDLRRRMPALSVGDVSEIRAIGNVLCFERAAGAVRILVFLNLGHEPADLALPPNVTRARLVISTVRGGDGPDFTDRVTLRPDEGLACEVVDHG